MTAICAILLGLAIAVAQILHGGFMVPALAFPSYGLLVLAVLFAVVAALRNPAPSSPLVLAAVIVCLGYIINRCSLAEDQYLSHVEIGQALAVGLAFMIGASALAGTRAKFLFIGIILSLALVQAVCGFIQFAKGSGFTPLGWFSLDLQAAYEARFLTRARGFFLNPNQFAWLQGWAMIFSVAIACWGRVSVIMRVLLIYLALVFLAADVLSGSRGGIVSLLGGLAVFLAAGFVAVCVAKRRGRSLMLVGSIGLILVCLGVGFAIYSSNYVVEGRFYSLESEEFRSMIAGEAWRQFQVNPLTGMGPGTFIYAARLYRTGTIANDTIFAHDDWLQTLAEYGLIGFALILLLVVISVISGFRRFFFTIKGNMVTQLLPFSNSTAILLASICALVTFSMHSVTDFNMHVPANALLAGATLGLLAGTGAHAASATGRLRTGVLRAVCVMVLIALGGGMTVFMSRHAQADYMELRARNHLARGDFKSALAETEIGLARQPHDAALLAARGNAFFVYESPDEDESEVDERRSAEEQASRYRSSVDAYEQAVKWQPKERMHRAGLARALSQAGRDKDAEVQWLEAIRLDPLHTYAYSGYADFLYDKGDLSRALQIYSLASQLTGGQYAARRMEDLREEMSSDPQKDTELDDETEGPDKNTAPSTENTSTRDDGDHTE